MHGRAPRYLDVLAPRLISREHPDATVLLRRLAIGATRRQRHKDVVVLRIGSHRVRFGHCGQIGDPVMGLGTDDGEHWTARIGECRQVIAMVARVVPDLITPIDLPNRCHDATVHGVQDEWMAVTSQ